MNIGLLGCGVVGGGILDFCAERADLTVAKVLVRRPRPELGTLAVTDIADITGDPTIGIVIEVMGGLHPAYEYICAALRSGKHVVTANKAVISAFYSQLTQLAAENGVSLRCTAAVGGGIPWLVNLERCKRLDAISELGGIMNGTTNFIMDAMHAAPVSFPAILKQTQELGYAEADPTTDVEGIDTWHKLIVSANIGFGVSLDTSHIPAAGISRIKAEDVANFSANGLQCKLVSTADCRGGSYCAFVQPTLYPLGQPEAAVPANYNLITLEGNVSGRQSFFGQGAGRYPTAYNVVQDCVDFTLGRKGPVDNSVKMRYYVRGTEDAWLKEHRRAHWGAAVVTEEVSVEEMHRWLKEHEEAFIAAFV